jgi:hypothetical protein
MDEKFCKDTEFWGWGNPIHVRNEKINKSILKTLGSIN